MCLYYSKFKKPSSCSSYLFGTDCSPCCVSHDKGIGKSRSELSEVASGEANCRVIEEEEEEEQQQQQQQQQRGGGGGGGGGGEEEEEEEEEEEKEEGLRR